MRWPWKHQRCGGNAMPGLHIPHFRTPLWRKSNQRGFKDFKICSYMFTNVHNVFFPLRGELITYSIQYIFIYNIVSYSPHLLTRFFLGAVIAQFPRSFKTKLLITGCGAAGNVGRTFDGILRVHL